MKITFIQPYYENVWEALGIGYIIAYVKKSLKEVGFDTDINFLHGNFDKNICTQASTSDIVAISCTSPTYGNALQIARDIKSINPDIHVVFGGWHPTALPEEVIKEESVDQVIVGEGELAMVRCILGSRQPILKGVKLSPDELEWPDRVAIKNGRTIDLCEKMNGKRTASFQLNRGCKVHCKFCSEVKMTGRHNGKNNPIRTRDFTDLLTEIQYAKSTYNIDYFKFVDATFDRDAHTVIDFCKAKIGFGNTLPWEANIHPSFVQRKDVFEWLAKANCQQINVGVESGSPYILNDVGKGSTIQQVKNVFRWAKECGIGRRAFFLLGMPDETDEDIDYTIELIDTIEPDVVGFTILAPYPGSDFYEPQFHEHVDWSEVDEYSNDIWSTANFSNQDLKDTQAYLVERFKRLLCERQA
ncbi:MAG: hypothetical protein DRR06_17100 [Gammaproteobacteria bacterium]|nr:MAG: hypothetical protein DRR06_17100 [Gammaproteobacteria bacterium]